MNTIDIQQHLDDEFFNLMNNKLRANVQEPDYVYHYTSIEAFLKIIESNTLWFSHMSFQNDPLEVDFGVKVLLDILSKTQNHFTHDLEPLIEIIAKMHDRYEKSTTDRTGKILFMFSLSAAGDTLPQWIQYGDNGNGVCVEFDRRHLSENVDKIMREYAIPVFCFPVQYYTNNYSRTTSETKVFEGDILNYYSLISKYIQEQNAIDDINIQDSIYLITKVIASFIKNDSFSKEEEWRLVMPTNKVVTKYRKDIHDDSLTFEDKANKIFVSSHKHSLKMYLRVPFGEAYNKGNPFKSNPIMKCVEHIILGPIHKDDDRIIDGIDMAILNNQGAMINVSFSNGFLRMK
jgi:hypothetical protein